MRHYFILEARFFLDFLIIILIHLPLFDASMVDHNTTSRSSIDGSPFTFTFKFLSEAVNIFTVSLL